MPEQCVTSWTVIEPVKDANSPTALHRPMAGSQQHSLSPETCVPAWGGGGWRLHHPAMEGWTLNVHPATYHQWWGQYDTCHLALFSHPSPSARRLFE